MFSIRLKSFLPIIASFVLLGAARLYADVSQAIPEIGDLERWAAFSLGHDDGTSRVFGHAFIDGDLGLAGNGNFLFWGHPTIDGDVYDRSNGTILTAGHPVITGSVFSNQDALLDNGVSEALAASDHAFALSPTRSIASINLDGNQNITIGGAPGETVVLSLKNFMLAGDSSFTLQGTATTTFIINVSKQFSLSGKSHIDLAGIQWNQVLFNVHGPGSRVTLKGNSILAGILMANNRTVKLRGHSTVTGEVIARKLNFHGSSRVLHPPILSPGASDEARTSGLPATHGAFTAAKLVLAHGALAFEEQ